MIPDKKIWSATTYCILLSSCITFTVQCQILHKSSSVVVNDMENIGACEYINKAMNFIRICVIIVKSLLPSQKDLTTVIMCQKSATLGITFPQK